MNRPVEVKPCGVYRIWLRYSDGASGEVDLSDLTGKGVFQAWEDPCFFDRVHVAPHGAVAWSEDIELCPDALYIELTGKSVADLLSGRQGRAADA